MSDSRRIIKVFLASPGDLSDERRIAKAVIDEYNSLYADDFGYQVELVGWEDTVSVFGRPQATINRDLERCEYFIGMLWKKWGTPPDVGGEYTSGFEEEFDTSLKRRTREGKPEISLLFKEIDPAFLTDPGEDLKKVLAFKERLVSEKKILFESFADIREFERRIRRVISNYVRQLRVQELSAHAAKAQEPTSGGEKQSAETTKAAKETPLSLEGAAFLRDLISRAENGDPQEAISSLDVARFRLLANQLGEPGNDDRTLGVHDANIIFSQGRNLKLGRIELSGLVSAGLTNYSAENAPLWYWLAAMDGFSRSILPVYTFIGSDTKRRVGAINAMRVIGEPIHQNDRLLCLERWFSESDDEIKVAALAYLRQYGITSDIATIRAEFDRNDSKTQTSAAEAIIAINLRESREKGFAALYELQPTSLASQILSDLFANPGALDDDSLLKSVAHASSAVRKTAFALLRQRRAITTEVAEKLINDNDMEVRYGALIVLVENGRTFSKTEAKEILSKKESGAFRRPWSLLGSYAYDPEADAYLDRFEQHRLKLLKDKELQEAAAQDSMYDRFAELVLAERRFDVHGDELRRRVDDRFNKAFAESLEDLAAKLGPADAETIEKARSLESFVRKQLTRRALEIVCRKLERRDLARIRSALKSEFVESHSQADVAYLQKYGEWEDIPLIVDVAMRPEPGEGRRGLLFIRSDRPKFQAAARAIYQIGRHRLDELLKVPSVKPVLVYLIAEISDKSFRELDPASVIALLNTDNDQVRKATALKCVQSLSRKKVTNLLTTYMTQSERHYYNVIHWLDLGISAPRSRAVAAAKRVLTAAWRDES
jgi:hypothetical protein